MENNEQKYTLEDAMRIVIGNLGNISFPASVLAVMAPDQIMNVKMNVIDPIETARRNLTEILTAYERARDEAEKAAEQKEEDEIVIAQAGGESE